MSISSMCADEIRTRSPANGEVTSYPASVSRQNIIVPGSEAHFAEGMIVERRLPNGHTEFYRVDRAIFRNGGEMSHWQLTYTKTDASGLPVGSHTQRSQHPSISISNSSNVQIGDSNSINVQQALTELLERVEKSNASDTEKREVRGLVGNLLNHPLVHTVLGTVAQELTRKSLAS